MEQRKWHELCNQGHLPVFRNIQAPQGRLWGARLFLGSKTEGEVVPAVSMGGPGKSGQQVCTPCIGGQISGAAGSQAGLSRTGGADPGHPGGTRQSGGTNARACDEREPVFSILCAPPQPSHVPDSPDAPAT